MSRRNSQPNTPVELTIRELDPDGFGLSEYQRNENALVRPVRVKGALPGELVSAKILKRRKGWLFAEALSIDQANAERRLPPCQAFPRCGGCTLQHLNYDAQLRHKQQLLLDALAREQVGYQRLRAPVSVGQLGYRHKARVGVKQLDSGLLVGFRESFSSRVGRMDRCETLIPSFTRVLPQLREALGELTVSDKIPQLELSAGDTAQQIVIRHLVALPAADLSRLAALEREIGMRLLLQPSGPESVTDLSGATPPLLSYRLPEQGLDLQFSALDFTQVNLELNRALVARVLSALNLGPGSQVLDLFCGVGNFSLAMARQGARVLGVEGSQASVDRAEANAVHNNLHRLVSFSQADLYSAQAATGKLASAPSLLPLNHLSAVVLDPPRSGAGPQLRHWLAPTVTKVVYVSCNPITFAADAAQLAEQGFILGDVGIFDMFPQTAHVETLGVFERTVQSATGTRLEIRATTDGAPFYG